MVFQADDLYDGKALFIIAFEQDAPAIDLAGFAVDNLAGCREGHDQKLCEKLILC
jgi:hypothetical protein